MRGHRRMTALVLLVLAGALMVSACGDARDGDGGAKVAARVNGVEVLDAEVQAAIAAARFSDQALAFEQARDQLVGEVLIRAEAEAQGVTFDEAEVTKRVDTVAEGLGGREALADALEEQGLSLDQYTDRVRAALLVERLTEAKFVSTLASGRQARTFFDGHRSQFTRVAQADLGDISVKTEPIATNVRRLILAGQSFAGAARQFTMDPEARDAGGRLGWVTLDSLPAPAYRVVTGLGVGELSRPVSLMGGWHIFKLYGRRAEKRFTYPEVRAEIIAELTRRRRAAALREWLAAARLEADIVVAP